MSTVSQGPKGQPLTVESRASALWAFVRNRHQRFEWNTALEIVRALAPTGLEDLKPFAKQLAAQFKARGLGMKHTYSLEAATRVLQGSSFHELQRHEPTSGISLRLWPDVRDVVVKDWREASALMTDACVAFLEANPAVLHLKLQVRENTVMLLNGVFNPGVTEEDYLRAVAPVFVAVPHGDRRPQWMMGLSSAIEAISRRVEGPGRAFINGYAAVQFCDIVPNPFPIVPHLVAQDAANTELVLVRDDYEVGPTGSYEIARGDELHCWSQFMKYLEGEDGKGNRNEVVCEPDAWRVGDARFEWMTATLKPKEYVPGLHMNQGHDYAEFLHRRFRVAKRIFNGKFPSERASKPIESLDQPDATARMDVHKLLHVLKNGGHTWESYCAEAGEQVEMTPVLPMNFVLSAIARFRPEDPNTLFAAPPRSEMVEVVDDTLLRSLMPRIVFVRYQVSSPTLRTEEKDRLKEAIQSFRVSVALRRGAFAIDDELPDMVYGADCRELYELAKELGLRMHCCVLPHLLDVPEQETSKFPNMFPYAFGRSLFLAFDNG